ncbi:hypothetical protein D3C81_1816450 [compost metagenome]
MTPMNEKSSSLKRLPKSDFIFAGGNPNWPAVPLIPAAQKYGLALKRHPSGLISCLTGSETVDADGISAATAIC